MLLILISRRKIKWQYLGQRGNYQFIKIEATFIVEELESAYKSVYQNWKSGPATAESAGDIVCRQYEKPKDTEGEASKRAANAKDIYNIMMR